MSQLPTDFVQALLGDDEPPERRWLELLPDLVDRMCDRWRLRFDAGGGPIRYGANAVVVPVCRDDEPCALKLLSNADDLPGEVIALRAWDGNGAVRLLEASLDEQAVLLERLDATRSLEGLPLDAAADAVGTLLRQLAVPAPGGLPAVADIAARMDESLPARQAALGAPIPTRWLDRARAAARTLAADSGAGTLVHADLHYGNVLAGHRQPWLAIDPRAVVGTAAYSVPELMWTRLDEAGDDRAIRRLLQRLVSAGGLDRHAAEAATIARAADYWLWGLANGLTIDPLRCRRLLACFAGPA